MKAGSWIFISAMCVFVLNGCLKTDLARHLEHSQGSRCPYDHVEMKEVPVIYGYPDDTLLTQAENNELILGGCIIRKNQPKTGYICPTCKRKFEKLIGGKL